MAGGEKPELNWLRKLTFSMIIALRGSETSRTTIGSRLANLLKYTHIKEQDIPLPSQSSHPSLSNTDTDPSDQITSRFSGVLKIASTQLDSKIGVIINASLLDIDNLNRLGKLPRINGALLIIIECISPEDDNDASHNVGDVRILVDMSSPFDAEKLISDLKPIAEEYQKVVEGRHKHLHALKLMDHPTEEVYKLKCKLCRKFVSNPAYKCARCNLFIFHQSCAESPKKEDLKQKPLQYLRTDPPNYNEFKQLHQLRQCTSCRAQNKGFSEDCHDCLLETNLKSELLPIVFNDKEYHKHPLSLIMMPASFNFEYKCSGCGEFGNCISYKCYLCNFDLHLNCVLLPKKLKYKRHVHDLTLRFEPTMDSQGQYHCDECQKQQEPKCWTYFCETCGFVAHVNCVKPTVGSDS